MKKTNTVSVPKAIKGHYALMKDRKRARAYLKLMIGAIVSEHEFKNRRYSEKDKGVADE